MNQTNEKIELFETAPVPSALAVMAFPTIVSQLITLIYNMADTWFIGRTKNPYMIAASSLVLTVFLAANSLANLFGVGGGNLVVRLLGSRREDEARKAASWSLSMSAISALVFSLLCFVLMNPLLLLLGASENTIGYARQYLLFVVVLGGIPSVLSVAMGTMIRNVGYAKEAGFGLSMGGVLNIFLDPLLMFVLLPDGYQVMGAGIATMLSNVASLVYFTAVYCRISPVTVLELPKRIEKLERSSLRSLFSVGIPAALALFLFDLTNIFINRLTSGYGDIELAAIGIVLKVERLPLNVGIGICLGMVPLVAYNYASGDWKRMYAFFSAARFAGVAVSIASVILYRIFAPILIQLFIDNAETVYYGTRFLRIRCFATPFMFLSFHMVHYMQSVDRGDCSLWLVAIRQLGLNIPLLFLLNRLFGMTGIVWTQAVADFFNVLISYVIYAFVNRDIQRSATLDGPRRN